MFRFLLGGSCEVEGKNISHLNSWRDDTKGHVLPAGTVSNRKNVGYAGFQAIKPVKLAAWGASVSGSGVI